MRLKVLRTAGGVWVGWPGGARFFGRPQEAAAGVDVIENDVRAPMTAKVVKVNVAAGAEVKEGDIVIVLEAMKMEYRLAAPRAGKVASIACKPGDLVSLGATLAVLA